MDYKKRIITITDIYNKSHTGTYSPGRLGDLNIPEGIHKYEIMNNVCGIDKPSLKRFAPIDFAGTFLTEDNIIDDNDESMVIEKIAIG